VGGCPVWNKHECSLSSLRHHTSLPSFTAALEESKRKREAEEDLRVGSGVVPGWWGVFEEVSGKLGGGASIQPVSSLEQRCCFILLLSV